MSDACLKIQNTNITLAISKIFQWRGEENFALKGSTTSCYWYFELIVKSILLILQENKGVC